MSEHRLDLERRQRLGLVEAIWGEHKSAEQIIAIARDFQRAGELALVTRVDETKAAAIQASIPELVHHRQARCLTLGELPNPSQPAVGLLCGGSSDLPVLAEAEAFAPLVDAFITDTFDPRTGQRGATGRTHPWAVSRAVVAARLAPVILAGGLEPTNVAAAIETVQPWAVDAHTGLEGPDGRKTWQHVAAFCRNAAEAFRRYPPVR